MMAYTIYDTAYITGIVHHGSSVSKEEKTSLNII